VTWLDRRWFALCVSFVAWQWGLKKWWVRQRMTLISFIAGDSLAVVINVSINEGGKPVVNAQLPLILRSVVVTAALQEPIGQVGEDG